MIKTLTEHWDEKNQMYDKEGWISKPSIFARWAKEYFPKNGVILDIGSGQGQDSRFLQKMVFRVVSTDTSKFALGRAEAKRREIEREYGDKVSTVMADSSHNLPFDDGVFDIVYSHISIYWFDMETTMKIFKEIGRVLKSRGIFALLVNSTEDPEYGQGKELEKDMYELSPGDTKRFFSVITLKNFIGDFEILELDNHGTTYKDEKRELQI